MFAHQVIEDSKRWENVDKEIIDKLVISINKSQKFHFGSSVDLCKLFSGNNGKEVFQTDVEYLKAPYNICWFDYVNYTDEKSTGGLWKRAFLIFCEENVINYAMFLYDKSIGFWYLSPLMIYIKVGAVHNDAYDYIRASSLYQSDINLDNPEEMKWMQHDLSVLEVSLRVLNCKNVLTEIIPKPIELNKKRKRNGKVEIFSYHILNISTKTKGKYTDGSIHSLSHNRIHLCRGHFKQRKTGLYWWQPHVRGQNKKGIVVKDYSVAT